jgi:hypothetical protein
MIYILVTSYKDVGYDLGVFLALEMNTITKIYLFLIEISPLHDKPF